MCMVSQRGNAGMCVRPERMALPYASLKRHMSKRIADMVLSAMALVALLPVFAIVALLVKVDSKGSVIYRQTRVGLRNADFVIYKFRTMYTGAEGAEPLLSNAGDARVTRVGRFLRRHHIDELPQLWNVICGDMSIVGPRPERRYYIDRILPLCPEYASLLSVRPGLTSLGSVRYGYASDVESMIERASYDLKYVNAMSFTTDLKIVAETIGIVVKGEGL